MLNHCSACDVYSTEAQCWMCGAPMVRSSRLISAQTTLSAHRYEPANVHVFLSGERLYLPAGTDTASL